MTDKVPYHAYEKRGQMIEERNKRIEELEAELEREQRDLRQWIDAADGLVAEVERHRAALLRYAGIVLTPTPTAAQKEKWVGEALAAVREGE